MDDVNVPTEVAPSDVDPWESAAAYQTGVASPGFASGLAALDGGTPKGNAEREPERPVSDLVDEAGRSLAEPADYETAETPATPPTSDRPAPTPDADPAGATVPPEATDPAPHGNTPVDPTVETVRSLFPGRVVETAEEARALAADYAEKADVYERFNAFVEGDPALYAYIAAVQGGANPRQAALTAFGELTAPPDKDEDPDAYADYKAGLARAEERARAEQQIQGLQQQKMAAIERQHAQGFDAFDAEMKGDPSYDANAFRRRASTLVLGDLASGRATPDRARILYNGLHHDRIVGDLKAKHAQELDEARKAAKLDGIRATKAQAAAVGAPPSLTGARSGAAATPQAESTRQWAREVLARPADPWDALVGKS